ncbi:hypothetical protein GCM10011575_34240 [Microlunatus endophyticus]|uniref:DUF2993 domain-containing protein n=1 Tax=Microlunatus endophyticus TaxID=1716077 RepID=A0A917W788_9ACTN|nr:DUF2993 domain-containing protein [Microlunatus endophyticus]GGL73100.1 hypothetical protein GCM10011575_34240 [Microlunatus endophyticus]
MHRRRGPLVLLLVVAIILALLVVADRLAPRIVADRVAATLQTALNTDQRPAVSLGGFPFLTQVATGHYQHIAISAKDVPIAGTGGRLSVTRLDGTLTDVHTGRTFRTITVGRFTGSATVSYAEISGFAGTSVSYDSTATNGDGFVTLKLPGSITVTGRPAIDGATHELYLARPQFRVGGRLLPGAVPDDLVDKLFRVRLPQVLSGVELSNVRAARTGLTLTASGSNITVRR